VGEYGHKFEYIYKIPSTNRWEDRSSQQNFGIASEGIKPEEYEDLG